MWAALTKGQSGLNHSRTTILPLYDAKDTDLPLSSVRVKAGAGLPSSALANGSVRGDDDAFFGALDVAADATLFDGASRVSRRRFRRASDSGEDENK